MGENQRMSVMMCTVGLDPAPVALAVLTCEPAPTQVHLVCSDSSRPVADRLVALLGERRPRTAFTVLSVGSGVSWRSCYLALADQAPTSPYLLDYTGGTTSMSMAAVKVHLERHHEVGGGADLRSYVDEQSGTHITDAGAVSALRTESVTIGFLARLHGVTFTRPTVLRAEDFPAVREDGTRLAFIEATRQALLAYEITDAWRTAWDTLAMGTIVDELRTAGGSSESAQSGRFVELMSLAAAVATNQWDEIIFAGKAGDHSEFDVLVRRGHRLVCIESKSRIQQAKDAVGHRMSTALSMLGSATRTHFHLLAKPHLGDAAATLRTNLLGFGQEIEAWKQQVFELQRIRLIHNYTPADGSVLTEEACDDPGDPITAAIVLLRRDLPEPFLTDGRRPATAHRHPIPQAIDTVLNRAVVMTALGGSRMLSALIIDNDPGRTVVTVGPRALSRLVPRGGSRVAVETSDLAASSVWRAACDSLPEAVIPTASKKSAGAGLLRYAHESGAAIEHILPRGRRELENGVVVPMTTPPRWDGLLTDSGYRPHTPGTEPWEGQNHALYDLRAVRGVVARWAGVEGATVYLSEDLRARLVAPVVITCRFLAFAVTSPFGGKKIGWDSARSFTAGQATVLDSRFGPAVRTWIAMSDDIHRQWLQKRQRPVWEPVWARLQILSGVDREHLAAPPWTLAELDATIGKFLDVAPPR